ncbi:MAG TPA: PEP-utilizing protein mobile subunit, partial [Gammaproteobacteria bacterium]|nr:PEP-utilizing protein mobile subunit [Gammaproteobacteria bacterium]
MGKATTHPFPLPSEVKPVAGTEGSESMYPYFTRVRPEDDGKFWFYNSLHFPDPMPAFDMVTAEIAYIAMGAYTTRVFAIPPALGVEHRVINGRIYISVGSVTDERELARRAEVFQERAG